MISKCAYLDFFDRCFIKEYDALIREFKDQDTFRTCLTNGVIPSIIRGASDQTNIGAFHGKTLCGTVSFATRGAFTYIWGLYVDPAMQRRGIGANLLRTLCEMINGSTTLSLHVMEDSEKAVQFYHKCGFHVTERITAEVFPKIWRPIYVMQMPSDQCLQYSPRA